MANVCVARSTSSSVLLAEAEADALGEPEALGLPEVLALADVLGEDVLGDEMAEVDALGEVLALETVEVAGPEGVTVSSVVGALGLQAVVTRHAAAARAMICRRMNSPWVWVRRGEGVSQPTGGAGPRAELGGCAPSVLSQQVGLVRAAA